MNESQNPQRPASQDNARVARNVLLIVGMTVFTICLVCCGGPIVGFFWVKKSVTERLQAPATPKPLSPNELIRWYGRNKPTEPFTWRDITRDNVELIGTVVEINSGKNLRTTGVVESGRRPLTDLQQGFTKDWHMRLGKAQLIFDGDRSNQEVACWFESVASIASVSVGDEVVVRGHKISLTSDSEGGFALDLTDCELIQE